MSLEKLLLAHKDQLLGALQKNPFIVFLCGPTATAGTPAAKLRKDLRQALEAENFEVVLGEDDGLEEARLSISLNAQDNELLFISKNCGAVIIIASSVGSYCELGLFSWHFSHADGMLRGSEHNTDCIILIEKQYQGTKSYLNEGPAKTVNGFGKVEYVDFANYDFQSVLGRLKDRRAVITVDNRRGRPRRHEENN